MRRSWLLFKYFEVSGQQTIFARPSGEVRPDTSKYTVIPTERRNFLPDGFFMPKSDVPMTYAEKLRDPKWQRLRLETMQRDDFTCTNCGSNIKELQIHHLDYEPGKEPWEYPKEFLTTLCRECHAKEQDRAKHEEMLIQSLRVSAFHVDDIVKLSTLLHFHSFAAWLKKEMKKVEGNIHA